MEAEWPWSTPSPERDLETDIEEDAEEEFDIESEDQNNPVERDIETDIEEDAVSFLSEDYDNDSPEPSPKIKERELDFESEDRFNSVERYIETGIEENAVSVQYEESAKASPEPSPKIEERELNIKSEDKFDSDDELIPIIVPKGVFDKATVRLIDDLREELRRTKSLLFAKAAEIEGLQKELSDAEALIADMQSRERDEASATSNQLRTTSRQPSQSLPQKCLRRVQCLPWFDGKYMKHTKSTCVSFINVNLCRQMGWERNFQDRFNAFPLPAHRIKHLYIPGRIIFVHSQHALAIVPKTQTIPEHDFELLSPFDELFGEERAFFFDRTTHNQHDQDVFYAGTYRIVRLNDICPEGVVLKDLNRRFRKQHSIDCIVDSIADAQMQRPLLGKDEIKKLVESGVIKLDLIGLQCVGFDEGLYERMIRAAEKRKQVGHDYDGPGGSRPRGKRRKVD